MHCIAPHNHRRILSQILSRQFIVITRGGLQSTCSNWCHYKHNLSSMKSSLITLKSKQSQCEIEIKLNHVIALHIHGIHSLQDKSMPAGKFPAFKLLQLYTLYDHAPKNICEATIVVKLLTSSFTCRYDLLILN